MEEQYYISTDKSKLQLDVIVDFLNNKSYWAQTRSKAIIEKSIANSICFGVFTKENKQVGFARVITDFAVFAWLLDVFIIEDHQGKGLGKMLMQEIMSNNDFSDIRRWGLGTDDAHGLYEKFGFTPLSNPAKMMEKINK
ncbi:GNAT family N-acetyltransferase [Sphingobacterium sp.]|uniref:GNAT family N-acetyltransferase n=1 Tax=Sphingobacterium sp. TaxID=341027 RepID=UPI002FD8EFA5